MQHDNDTFLKRIGRTVTYLLGHLLLALLGIAAVVGLLVAAGWLFGIWGVGGVVAVLVCFALYEAYCEANGFNP